MYGDLMRRSISDAQWARRVSLVALTVTTLCGCPQAEIEQRYTVLALPVEGATYVAGEGMSQSGLVVGGAYDDSDAASALMRADSGLRALDGNEERPQSYAFAVNDARVAAGYITGTDTTRLPARWRDGALEVLPTLGGDRGEATGISECGRIVGTSRTAGDVSRPFLWDETNGIVELSAVQLGGETASASDISCTGFVSGSASVDEETRHAYRLNIETDELVDLGTLGGTSSFANAVNEVGSVAGLSDAPNDEFHPFFWSEEGDMVDLFEGGDLGAPFRAAYDVNNLDQVVGYCEIDDEFNSHAFLWSATEGLVDLNDRIPVDSGWVLVGASAINDAGQIAGWGTFLGQPVGFVLSPVCEE